MGRLEKGDEAQIFVLNGDTYNEIIQCANEWNNLVVKMPLKLTKGESQSILEVSGNITADSTGGTSEDCPFFLSFKGDKLYVNPGTVHSIFATLNGQANTGLETEPPYLTITQSGYLWLEVTFDGNQEPLHPVSANIQFSTDATKAETDTIAWQVVGTVQFAEGRIKKTSNLILNSLDVCRQRNSSGTTYLFGAV